MKHEFRGEQITIAYDDEVCQHAAQCVGKFPAIYDLDRDPWIDPDQGSVEDAKTSVANCPSGALSIPTT